MTNRYLNSKMLRPCLIIAVLSITFSYSSFAGGDHYEIYLNKKLITKHFVTQSAPVLNLQLDKDNYNQEITIYYSHCGVTGKDRAMVLKDSKGKLLKEWKFDNNNNTAAMNIRVKDILDIKMQGNDFTLYYTSKELPNGRMLTVINFNNKNTAGYKKIQPAYGYLVATSLSFFTRMFI